MKTRNRIALIAGMALVSACGAAIAQLPGGLGEAPPTPNIVPGPPGHVPPLVPLAGAVPPGHYPTVGIAPVGYTPPPATPPVAPQASPNELNIDQLIDAVKALRAEKAELEKREQEMLKAIRLKAEKLRERMKEVGADTPVDPPKVEAPTIERPKTEHLNVTAPALRKSP